VIHRGERIRLYSWAAVSAWLAVTGLGEAEPGVAETAVAAAEVDAYLAVRRALPNAPSAYRDRVARLSAAWSGHRRNRRALCLARTHISSAVREAGPGAAAPQGHGPGDRAEVHPRGRQDAPAVHVHHPDVPRLRPYRRGRNPG
jgi:hypothetical protein